MNARYNFHFIWLVLCVLVSSASNSYAQDSSFELWPETDIWYRINPSWRLSAFIPITKYHESQNRDLNIYLQADYAWGRTTFSLYRRLRDEERAAQMRSWLLRWGFMEGWSLGDNPSNYTEDMLFAEIHKRDPLIGGILLSHRIRVDLRWVGEDPDLSYRFRYRVMLEKEYTSGNSSIVPYVNIEPFWDSRYATFSRVRIIGGATFSWGPRWAFEGNLTYQYDSHYDTSNLYALNLIVHLFFEAENDDDTN